MEKVMSEQKDDFLVLKEAIVKEMQGYRYIVNTLFKQEYFYNKSIVKYDKDPLIRNAVPWPLCEFIEIKLNSYRNYTDDLFDLLNLRERSKKYHLYEDAPRFQLTITSNFDIRYLFAELFTLYDPLLIQTDLINEYQIRCKIIEQTSYYMLKNDLHDFIEDFFKPPSAIENEKNIINNVKSILNQVEYP